MARGSSARHVRGVPEKSREPIARPRPGATRCPYCHEECEPGPDACACAECLSRHHRACWDEQGSCGSCRGTARLEAAAPTRAGDSTVIDAWLKLGGVYNGGLAAVTLLLLNVQLVSPLVLVQVAFGALIANACFLLGPAIELVARRCGYDGGWLRWLLFVPGFLFALLLALVSCVTL